jgi:putative tryptophan/tyrosine transport system substrate-binding protein
MSFGNGAAGRRSDLAGPARFSGERMRRRDVLALVAGSAFALSWRGAGYAQPAKIPTVGILVLGTPDPAPLLRAFREGLAGRGYIEGQNIRIEFRSAEGRSTQLPAVAAELVSLKVDVIVASQTPSVTVAKEATREIPIVMAPAGDPVGTGLVASLARPGGNITGLSGTTAELAVKNLELIRELAPQARRIAVLANATDPFTKPFIEQLQAAARQTDVVVAPVMIRPSEDAQEAFEQIMRGKADALIIQPSLLRKGIADLTLKHRILSLAPSRTFVDQGGLMSYASKVSDLQREAATYVDKILKGAKPADLPVQQPTTFELVINLKAAKALGITVPPTVLARADEVIE